MSRAMVALALFGLAGCSSGKVKTDALDFGKVKSAEWMERKLVSDNGDEHTHDFVLVTQSGWCKKATNLYPKLGAAWADVLATIADNPSDATIQCEARLGFYEMAAAETESVFKNGLSIVHMSLLDPNEETNTPPFEGSYETVGYDEVDRYILASVARFESNPYRLYADTADCENTPGTLESDGNAALQDIFDLFTLDEGIADVSKKGEAYDITLDGSLVQGDGTGDAKAAGELTTKATYDYCDLTWNGEFPEFF